MQSLAIYKRIALIERRNSLLLLQYIDNDASFPRQCFVYIYIYVCAAAYCAGLSRRVFIDPQC